MLVNELAILADRMGIDIWEVVDAAATKREKAERAVNDRDKPVRGSRVLLVGVSYKAGVSDRRESPALKIIELLRGR